MNYVISMFVDRPYVVSFVLTFMIVAAAERGWLKMLVWLFVGTFIGWLSEYCSQRTGFPYGFYSYYPSRFENEFWISNVPLFASLSYAASSYLGFSLTYTLFSPLRIGKHGVERVENPRIRNSLKVALWSCLVITWSDFAIDPVTHLGKYWFLGEIYQYVPGDFGWMSFFYNHLTMTHFDVPLSNYFGWLVTFFVISLVMQRIDQFMESKGMTDKPAFSLPSLGIWSIGYFIGNFLFILAVNIYLYFNPAVPAEKQIGLVLVNTLAFATSFIVFNLLVFRKKLADKIPLAAAAL